MIEKDILEDIVPYQQSFDLKELGFNESCLAFYEHGNEIIKFVGVPQRYNDPKLLKLRDFCAPTYSQVFKWILEKHNLDYALLPESSSRHKLLERTYNVVIFRFIINLNVQSEILRDVNGNIVRFISRRNAELECLKKMIEIIKEK